jgi:two-component system, OmpR family, phosphate regulon sensor histidine kinase PhoR
MDKRVIQILMTGITLGLLGLVVIQFIWMRSNIKLQEARLSQGISNAMFAVSERLERMEKFRALQDHEAGRKLLLRLDTLRRPANMQEPVDAREQESGLGRPATSQDMAWPLRMEEHEELVNSIVRSILATRWEVDPRDRVDPTQLDTILREEFRAHGLPLPEAYGIFTTTGEAVLVPLESRDKEAEVLASPHRERLFRYDIVGPEFHLHVLLPVGPGMVLPRMLPMIILSMVFVLIMIFAFFHTVRTIVRQKRINDIRNDLVNNLTHELKTPISTISLACEALMDPSIPRDLEQGRKLVNMIRDENKRLGSLVENVLQSAVMDSGHMVMKRVDLDLHGLIHDVVRSSSIQVSRRNGRIDLDLKAEIHHLKGDRIHLTNLIYNLVDNAVKYTEKEPRIILATHSTDDGILLRVTDNGIGIPRAEQQKIFDKLYRVPTGNIHNAKGFGLGLSYARTVVERHGGRIDVESEPGRGSTFTIFLPYEHVREQQASAGRG